jgi:hypothetical protein
MQAPKFRPIGLALRDRIERHDPDGDGKATAMDVTGPLLAAPRVGSFTIHVVPGPGGGAPVILEVNAARKAARAPAEDMAKDTLAATNHHRSINAPTSCTRYENLQKLSKRLHGKLDLKSLWAAMDETWQGEMSMQTMAWSPKTRTFRVWLRSPDYDGEAPAWEKGTGLDLGRLFGLEKGPH